MTDQDLEAAEASARQGINVWNPDAILALVAEVRRLRVFRDQAAKQFIIEWPKGTPEIEVVGETVYFKSEPLRIRAMTLDDARALARREALEQAAKVAESACHSATYSFPGSKHVALEIADRIRGLKGPA